MQSFWACTVCQDLFVRKLRTIMVALVITKLSCNTKPRVMTTYPGMKILVSQFIPLIACMICHHSSLSLAYQITILN